MISTLHQSLEYGAIHYPERDLFKSDNGTFTYGEANHTANQLAGLLIQNGLQIGDKVGILMARNSLSPVAVYGCLKAGGVVIPIDPQSPTKRMQYIIDDCQIQHLISEEKLAFIVEQLSIPNAHLYGLTNNHSWSSLQNMSLPAPSVTVSPNNLAYIMYTSGTTGTPKGIMHTHYSGVSYARLSTSLYNINSHDYILSHSPLHFDMCTLGYFSAPYVGASAYILPEMYSSFPTSLSKLMEEEQFTIWYSVPLILLRLLDSGALKNKNLSSLRWVLFAGEAMPTEKLNALIPHFKNAWFSNIYGPAEVNQCTYFNTKTPITNSTIPLGQVWDETEALIINEQGDEIHNSEMGELLIHSSTMLKGYINNEELTKKAFFYKKEKAYYRTGDLVHIDEQGLMFFHGRRDRQVKIKGSRVELSAVDTALLQFPGIEHAVSFVTSQGNENELKAAFIAKNSIDKKELLNFVSTKLPKYAVPQAVYQFDELPRTPAGKINYKELIKKAGTYVNS